MGPGLTNLTPIEGGNYVCNTKRGDLEAMDSTNKATRGGHKETYGAAGNGGVVRKDGASLEEIMDG